jgi:PAS domain S-box-containing protein
MAARMRAFDWSSTPLGPMAAWPQSLKTAVDICLGSGFASYVWWGPELIQLHNDAAARLVAQHPAGLGRPAADAWREVWRDVAPLMAEVLATGAAVTRQDLPFCHGRGAGPRTAYFTFTCSPLRDEAGALAGVMGVVIDTTAQVTSLKALRASQERFRQFADASSDVLWIRNAETLELEFLSPAFERVYGLTVERALIGDTLKAWTELIVPADREAALAQLGKLLAGERVAFEYRVRRPDTGEVRWIRDTDFPIRDFAGRLRRIGGVAHDVTAETRTAHHQVMLLAELQHRTRNLLGVIRGVARRTAETSEDLESFLTHFDGRLSAIARTQTALARNNDVSASLDALVLEEFLAAACAEQVTLDGPEVQLCGKVAESISLAVHELVTNALKYGALTTPKGHVYVTWAVSDRDGGRALALHWRETGVGVIDVQPRRVGFGRRLLEKALPYELGALTTLRFAPGGLQATIEISLKTESGHGMTSG